MTIFKGLIALWTATSLAWSADLQEGVFSKEETHGLILAEFPHVGPDQFEELYREFGGNYHEIWHQLTSIISSATPPSLHQKPALVPHEEKTEDLSLKLSTLDSQVMHERTQLKELMCQIEKKQSEVEKATNLMEEQEKAIYIVQHQMDLLMREISKIEGDIKVKQEILTTAQENLAKHDKEYGQLPPVGETQKRRGTNVLELRRQHYQQNIIASQEFIQSASKDLAHRQQALAHLKEQHNLQEKNKKKLTKAWETINAKNMEEISALQALIAPQHQEIALLEQEMTRLIESFQQNQHH